MISVKAPKKLIEVALPLDDINEACAAEANPFTPRHPRSLHIWWARRRIAAVRAVLFAQMVNDPGYERHLGRGVNKTEAAKERERLFGIMRALVQWKNVNDESVLAQARDEIWKSWRETCHLNRDHPQAAELFDPLKMPVFHDPFAGGGTIPLEAQRLGLEAHASDLNPVAVLINKAIIEIPPQFAARSPIGPLPKGGKQRELLENWNRSQGLAEDVRRYGQWMSNEAQSRIGHLYPDVEITQGMTKERPDLTPLVGQKLRVIAWLWARTVKSPNPAYGHVDVPLASTFILSRKEGKEAWVEPVVKRDSYRFLVRVGMPNDRERADAGTKASGRGAHFRCVVSGSPIDGNYIKKEGKAGRMGAVLMAVVAEGVRRRVYLSPSPELADPALAANPSWSPPGSVPERLTGGTCYGYGLTEWGHLFTPRQLVAMTTLADLVQDVRVRAKEDAVLASISDDGRGIEGGGTGATARADAVATYLGLSVSRWADLSNNLVTWNSANENFRALFSRQAIPMAWDFAEVNPFGPVAPWISTIESQFELSANLAASTPGHAFQKDASSKPTLRNTLISTDPPYYDNIGYADLSDFFYVWLRRSLKSIFPDLFATLAAPKEAELVASAYRHGGREAAESFFVRGMTSVMHVLAQQTHPGFPLTVYYAFKQSESKGEGTGSSGWESFLQAMLTAGLSIHGTWPMRTEREVRSVSLGANALASSIVLVCRQRDPAAPSVSRRDFIRELNAVLPEAIDEMTRGAEHSPVAPVDLSQAILGPGMAIFSKYSAVLEADGKPMSVQTALQLINRFLAEDDFDHDTQFCLHWFESNGWNAAKFGDADVLARAKGTSVAGVAASGVLESGASKVRLLRYAEYPDDWKPEHDSRTPVWEALHHLIRALQTGGGESAAGMLVRQMPGRLEAIRQLAYRLYTLCERQGWAEDARAYNELITSWPAIEAAGASREDAARQTELTL